MVKPNLMIVDVHKIVQDEGWKLERDDEEKMKKKQNLVYMGWNLYPAIQ